MEKDLEGVATTAKIGTHPIHPMLIPFPIGLLSAGFACDFIFWITMSPFWAEAAFWSVLAGTVMTAVAALAGFTDFFGNARIRQLRTAWEHMIGNVTVLLLSLISLWIRLAQGHEEAILPWGLLISALVVLVLFFTGWKGGELVFNHRVGVQPSEPAARRLDKL
jgi:uncharacterized membrane protein